MGIKPITVSFKNTKEDLELYNWITSHSNLSGFIKDILRTAKENKNEEVIKAKTESNVSKLIDLDF